MVEYIVFTLKVLVVITNALGHFLNRMITAQWEGIAPDRGCRVGEVQADTTSPMPDHNGFKLQ